MKKKDTEILEAISELFRFKTVYDENRNEYVVFANSQVEDIINIEDRTQFEAVENHVHLLENIGKSQLPRVKKIADSLGNALINSLHGAYPDKRFSVFATYGAGNDLTIRFHQKWDNEPPYFDPENFAEPDETVVLFEI